MRGIRIYYLPDSQAALQSNTGDFSTATKREQLCYIEVGASSHGIQRYDDKGVSQYSFT